MAGAKGLRKGQKSEKPGGVVQLSNVVREWSRGGVREERRALPCPLLVGVRIFELNLGDVERILGDVAVILDVVELMLDVVV